MKARTTTILAALLLAAIPVTAQTPPADTPAAEATQEEIDAVVAQVKAALANDDIAAVNAILADHPSVAIAVAVRVVTDIPNSAAIVAAAAALALPPEQAPAVASAVVSALPATATRADANRVRVAVIRSQPQQASEINRAVNQVVQDRSFTPGPPTVIPIKEADPTVISPSTP